MRSAKSSGGLTRKRGFDENQRAVWIKSMPARAAANKAIEKLTNSGNERQANQSTSQDLKFNKSSERDHDDIQKVYEFFELHPPFQSDRNLRYRHR